MQFTVYGPCVGKQRPRMTRTGHTYTPKATKDYESEVLMAFAMEENDLIFDNPVAADIQIFVTMPKAWSKKRKAMNIDKPPIDIRTPDLDNVAKSILDALNGVAYKDDKQVVSLEVNRMWGIEDKVVVELFNV